MELSQGNKETAIQILDRSANGGWSDLYKLDNKKLSIEERFKIADRKND